MKGEACTSSASGTPSRTCIKDFCKDFFCEVDANGAVTQYPQSTTVRKEIIKKSSAYITTWMYVLHEYRDAVGDCENDSLTDNNASVHATDEAMAFYTGELEGQTGFNYARDNAGDLVNKVGYLMHNLADKRCNNFGTCTGKPENTSPDPSNIQGASAVNTKVAELAQQFAAEVTSTACTTAAETLKLIEAQMTVPLVQGTIRYAYKCHKSNASLKSMAEGAVFWMSIAPQVAACNPTGAAVIQAAMLRPMTNANEGPYAGGASKFQEIMGVLQGCYSSMGITCADVGGLIDPLDSTGYATCVDPAPPAPATSTVKETTNDMPDFVLPAIIVLALLLAVFLGFCVHARAQANHFKVMYDQFAQAGGKATPGRRV
jgi:Notch-like protein